MMASNGSHHTPDTHKAPDSHKIPETPDKHQIPDQLIFELKSELSDVALYSYTGLCAYSFSQLFDGSQWDREIVEKWITKITEHNGQGEISRETMKSMARAEVRLENADPFIESLRTDPFITQHGLKVVVHDLMRLAVEDGCYDSRLRTLVKFLSLILKLDWQTMEIYENRIVEHLREEEHKPTEEELKERDTHAKKTKIKRYALIGVAAVGGGALLGLTGGLAAPFIAAGAGAVIGGAGATVLASTAGVAIIGSLFGVAGLGLGGYKMKKRVGGIEEFEFEPLSEGRQLHITIALSGWLTDKVPEFKTAWMGLANSKEQYVLKYESKYLLQMGTAMDYLVAIAINAATQEALKYTILSGILAAIAWPAALLSAASVIDNPWSVCTHRAANVGQQLADVLLSRQQGKRPVTLIGFSLGARVIFYCLKEMAKRKNCEGIIEDVILLGTPVTGNPKEWEPLARVVAGKIVNGYCKGDWLLKFLYRTASIQFSVAGLKAVDWKDRRMHNIDLSDVVQGHIDYMNKIDEILNVVGINTREHATRRDANSLQSWVQIQKSSSVTDRLHDNGSSNHNKAQGAVKCGSDPVLCNQGVEISGDGPSDSLSGDESSGSRSEALTKVETSNSHSIEEAGDNVTLGKNQDLDNRPSSAVRSDLLRSRESDPVCGSQHLELSQPTGGCDMDGCDSGSRGNHTTCDNSPHIGSSITSTHSSRQPLTVDCNHGDCNHGNCNCDCNHDDCKHDNCSHGDRRHCEISPPIQSNNIGKQLQEITLDQGTDLPRIDCSDTSHGGNINDISPVSYGSERESQDGSEREGREVGILEVSRNDFHSDVSDLVTTPDSGILCDESQ